MKPFSQACENNAQAIAAVLQRVLRNSESLLEIGSGTGQHAVYCAPRLSHLQWQTSDLIENHAGINAWIDDCDKPDNIQRPIVIDVDKPFVSDRKYDAVFSANTLHILSWKQVEQLFNQLPQLLLPEALLLIYGPFNYQGAYTSESNARFDDWLKGQSPFRGIRDSEAVDQLALENGFTLVEDNPMPANNRLRVWRYSL